MGMYNKDGFYIEGLVESLKSLAKLGVRLEKEVASKVVSDTAKFIKNKAKQNAPEDTGELKKHIVALKMRQKDLKKGEVGSVVLVRKIRKLSVKNAQKLSKKIYTRKTDKKVKAHVFYAHMVEYGTKHSKAKPFMSPAIEAGVEYLHTRLQKVTDLSVKAFNEGQI